MPLTGLTVNQSESTAIVQLEFEVIEKVVLPADDPTSRLNGVTASTLIPLCVTVTEWGLAPDPDTVIVPILAEVNVFGV